MSKRMIAAALAMVGMFVALYLTLYKIGVIGQLTCTVGSCETVNTSQWSTFLGQPVALWGLGFYVTTLLVTVTGLQDRFADSRVLSQLLVAMSGFGVLFSAWLTYLELFVIHAICMWCVISAIIVTMIFVTSVMDLREVVAGTAEYDGDEVAA
ncbi:MAG TPA: vitamin K epoxide reductase family protein [Gemmatimonadaceae bacterium]|nr:vitamin K epoxide reductase family protein [Gemmatimonadaceae bacterium]